MDAVLWARRKTKTNHLYESSAIDSEAFAGVLSSGEFAGGGALIAVPGLHQPMTPITVEVKVRPARFVSHVPRVRG